MATLPFNRAAMGAQLRQLPTGLMAPPNPEQPESQGLLSRFFNRLGQGAGMVFGGSNDPRLSEEQNRRARSQALIQAGLGTIMGAQQSGATALGSLAQGAMYGQQAGTQARDQIYAQDIEAQRREKLQALVESGQVDRGMLRNLFAEAIASGDMDGARSIAQVLQVMENVHGQNDSGAYMVKDTVVNPQTGRPEIVFFDRRNPTQPIFTGMEPEGSGYNWQIKEVVDPETGKPILARVDPRTGKWEHLGLAPTPSSSEANRDRLDFKDEFARANGLRDDYERTIKETESAYNLIRSALQNVDKAVAGDAAAKTALLYGFIRALDPESVVREGEVRLARAAMPIRQRAQVLLDDINRGESPVISPQMAQEMAEMMQEMQGMKRDYMGSTYQHYLDEAEYYKVRPGTFRKPPGWAEKQEITFDDLTSGG